MSWSIGLHLGESVVEVAGRSSRDPAKANSEPLIKQRMIVPQGSPHLALGAFFTKNEITEVDHVQILTNLPLKIIDAAHGSPIAVLTTLGFENWLEMAVPLKTAHFTTRPERNSFLLDHELIFGVQERTNASGHIEKLLDENELEFLVSKLALHEIKNVAICFLHSNRNAENEKRSAAYLTAKGFQVFLSSAVQTSSTGGPKPPTAKKSDEKSRFWSAIYNAYASRYYLEILTAVQAELQKVLKPEATVKFGPHDLADVLAMKVPPLETAFSFTNFVSQNFARTTPLFYCGIEDFLFFRPHTELVHEYSVPTGALAFEHSPFVRPQIQPLTRLGRGFFSEFTLTSERITLDPGPILFGRGLAPTLLDLLLMQDKSEPVSGIKEKIQDRGRTRLTEALAVYARNMADSTHLSGSELAEQIVKMAGESWRYEILQHLPQHHLVGLTLCGPLAHRVQKYLGGQVIGDDFFLTSALLKDVK